MSTGRLSVMVCELFKDEIKAIAASGDFPELEFSTYVNRCGRPPLTVAELRGTLGSTAEYDRVILLGGCCLAELESQPNPSMECRIIRLDSCFSLVAGSFSVNRYLREGAYLVTPGWLQNWQDQLALLGFEGKKELAGEFFAESAASVLLLDTGTGDNSHEAGAEFAAYIDRPFAAVPVGLDLLRLRIENAATLWQAETFSQSGEMLQRTCADYAMTFDLLDLIAQSYEEEEIIKRILTMFQALFAATGVAFASLTDGVPDKVTMQGEFPKGAHQELLAQAAGMNSDYILPEEMQGRFLFKVVNRGQTMGIVMVDGLTLPRYREQYLNLALSTGELSGIILKNARIFLELNVLTREMSRQRDELQKAYSDLRDVKALAFQQEKLTSVGQLAAGVAHEINNPLGFIISNLGTLEKYLSRIMEFVKVQTECLAESGIPRLQERAAESSRQLKIRHILQDTGQLITESAAGAERVHKIIRYLIQFAAVAENDLSRVDINDCLEKTILMVQNRVAPLGRISRIYGAIPLLLCSPRQLSQMFMNLLINATQALADNGVITVSSRLESGTEPENDMNDVTGNSRRESGTICVTIADTGCGIPPENLSRIFEPFFTTREVGMGTGLGLSLSYDIVKRHGGELTVKSILGSGSTFTVRLPVDEGSAAPWMGGAGV